MIFDCDGVLVDSEPISARIGAEVLTDLGWPVTESEVLELFLGRSDEYFRDVVRSRLGRPLGSDWEERTAGLYEQTFDAELRAVAGVRDLVRSLVDADVPLCVASNGSHHKMRSNLQRTQLLDVFEGRMFSADDVPRPKPAPDLFRHAARALGVPPHSCVVVEDSPAGVAAALGCGMTVIGFAARTPAGRLADATVVADSMQGVGAALASRLRPPG